MSLSKPTTRIGPFVRDDSRDSKPTMEDEEGLPWDLRDATLMYNDGEMPWVERGFIRVGDVRKYAVGVGREMLVNEWNRHDSHAMFMNDLVLPKNLEEIGLMFCQPDATLYMGFKHPVTLGDQTDVKHVWFWY